VAAETILIVEDDEPTQRLLQTVLRRVGFASDTAANGAEAIEMLRGKEYATVVLDIMMPVVSGMDVIAFLRDGKKTTPVVVCSAAGPKALAELDTTMVRAVLRKPFDIDEFIATITGLARPQENLPA
jgi:DNA-binding response OmpR family regulator